ncbi:methyl-accepting chemotaxis protein [Rhizobium sp. PP-F2F-G38]|nr:methyl-accepting chemotaxis protein [Rhizobium sp. PP-WC-1G-195]PYE98515.1 methyl-accepting chemotaxis protein [Rhizobium sp. PP-F2F-G38]
MRIRGKISLIVIVMSVVTLVVAGMAFAVVARYDSQLAAYKGASERAYNGEKLNRLVTAVVMESRGIYAAPTLEKAEPFAEGLLKTLDKIDVLTAEWRPLVPQADLPAFEAVVGRAAEFRTFRMETARLARAVSLKAANEQGNTDQNRANRKAFQAEIDAVVTKDKADLTAIQTEIDGIGWQMTIMIAATALIGLAAGLLVAVSIARRELSRPISDLTRSMTALAGGDLDVDLPEAKRSDEIGEMARAVEVFRSNGLTARRTSSEDGVLREKTADLQVSMAHVVEAAAAGDFSRRITRTYGEPSLDRFAGNVNELVAGVDRGIGETGRVIASLAQGDLTQPMTGDFQGAFAELQRNVNETLSVLQKTLGEVRSTTLEITGASGELRSATDDLAKRTEQQAASLEQTSASLGQITVAVQTSTERAQEATVIVTQAKEAAAQSGTVVRSAVDAMGRIEQASSEIGKITNVIDEIAFQTNLLALNAGVEAARAGEAGKGFAVVAQEVRELAQRAARAAKDIKVLIAKSGAEVSTGVQLVQETGQVLGEIESRVLSITDHIHSIATAAREQATGLGEVSTAVNQMDKVTQQNAAMVEEANAATHRLSTEAENLAHMIGHFRLDQSKAAAAYATSNTRPGTTALPARPAPLKAVAPRAGAPRPVSATARPVASPARKMMGSVARAFSAGPATHAAPVPAASQDNWEEF